MNRDLVFGCAMLAVAAACFAFASAIPDTALADAVGPAGLPKAYASVLAALSLILIASNIRDLRIVNRESRITNSESRIANRESRITNRESRITNRESRITNRESRMSDGSRFTIHNSRLPRVAGLLLIGVLYVVLVPWLGYVVSIAALIAATTYYQGGRLNRQVALIAVGGATFLWLLFVQVLGIAQPAGAWW